MREDANVKSTVCANGGVEGHFTRPQITPATWPYVGADWSKELGAEDTAV